ncbi:KR domain-containing protein [Streptomyces alfalfae]|uniref:SDR family NAD(P)-dependent oxidoreductase n=1 Tax=Streptomyces alfalfae TaxID=1642299 RepID=A0A1P8TBX2_9ACTN|nr:SDR family NAD(P)-dependent oxidoreductase [Streptomyces alfalfae]AYA15471.1 SDR family NAD(P)-dependent oxidoreductase [Streptomyces fradiae]APY85126.1 short-chain dehydrogenase [Streptomyces alfalfae]QQC92564.1 SDR family NAD(P)-dependent oxidoreductase [Streptomyces alfalfae]RXX43863.1 KR domain-containing protein [Streptomyces alfalfae]RZM99969.1 SDR family NAD(P)-dependent oxidoreductase [Streptomyces alfalfae]
MATVLITGASDGLGRALAEDLAAAGHRLLLHGRNPERLAQVAAATGGEVFIADFASLAEVRRLAADVAARHSRLDVLVNNAGVGFEVGSTSRETSADGHELRLAVNHLAPALLTEELLPLLRRSAPARIVNVASVGQQLFDFDDPQHERDFSQADAYCRSKLAMISHTAHLAARLAGTGVTVNALHPATFMATTMTKASGVDAQEPLEKGVAATRRLVDHPDLAAVTGAYFHSEEPSSPSDPLALDDAYTDRLAALTRRLIDASAV